MRSAGRVFVWVLGALVIATVLAAGWIGVRAVLAYGHLSTVERTAANAREQLSDPAQASAAIERIAAETSAARALTADPVWRIAEGVPWIGPQLAAVSTVAAAADDVASDALSPLVEVASTFSFEAVTPRDGAIDLAGFTGIREAASIAASGVSSAAASVDDIDRRALVTPLRTAVDQVSDLLDEVRDGAGAVARATALLPAMLGADGPRNYLVLFQNNAEWRSLGGIPGAMALIQTDNGAIRLAEQDSTSGFPVYAQSVVPLSEEIFSIYRSRPGRWMQNVTMIPDFTLAAPIAAEMWAREHGLDVDGVISLDPVTLSYLLNATGPVELPSGDMLSSDNAVQLLLNEAYLRYPNPADQDIFFASATAAVFDALSNGGADPAELAAALARAGDERRLLLWSTHEQDQALLAGTTLAGGLPITDDDAARFGVYLNDGTGSKMDYYLRSETTVAWDSCSTAGGSTRGDAELTVTITNDAPADAASLPPYITGNGTYGVPPGSARTIAYVYLPEAWQLVESELSTGGGFGGGVHDQRRVVTFTVDLAPGESAEARLVARAAAGSASLIEAVSTPTIDAPSVVAASCDAG